MSSLFISNVKTRTTDYTLVLQQAFSKRAACTRGMALDQRSPREGSGLA